MNATVPPTLYRLALVSLALLVLRPPPVAACTTVQVKTADGKIFVGKSYDWNAGSGHAIFNKRGVAKRGLLPDPKDRPAEWVSKHASLTFNQFGRELPNGGLNDAGLMVEIMWLDETVFPARDQRRAVNELQWIQYQLDSHATVEEVVRNAPDLRPAAMYGKVHYLACDRSGACAAIEYLKGKLVATHGAAMVVNTLTNTSYADSVKALRTYAGFGGKQPIPAGVASTARFARASQAARQPFKGDPVARVLEVLDGVRIAKNPTGNITQWQIVYDLAALRVSWRTTASSAELKRAALADVAPTCSTPVTFADMNGDNSKFWAWTISDNRKLIAASTKSLKGVFPPGVLEKLAAYPRHLPCRGLAGRKPKAE